MVRGLLVPTAPPSNARWSIVSRHAASQLDQAMTRCARTFLGSTHGHVVRKRRGG
jgi:hypothetical protein